MPGFVFPEWSVSRSEFCCVKWLRYMCNTPHNSPTPTNTQAATMKIADIRKSISSANYSRQHLTGGTREEFIAQNVGPRLREHVESLRSLVIAPRFADDIAARDSAIERCEATIARWEEAQPKKVAAPSNVFDFFTGRRLAA